VADQGLDCHQVAMCVSDEFSTLDRGCLTDTQAEWDALNMNGKIQKIIDKVCAALGSNPIQVSDSATIDMSGNGTSGTPVTASVIISPDSGNTTVIHSNGIYTPAYTPPTPVSLCDQVHDAFTPDPGLGLQEPTFLIRTEHGGTFDQGECFRVAAPTGFAVGGPGRVSVFGAMEFYDTLANANAAAVSGETIIVYEDSTDNITAASGVSFFGVGDRMIGNLTMVTGAKLIKISSITVKNLTLSGTSTLQGTNFTAAGQVMISGSVQLDGVSFIGATGTVVMQGTSKLRNIYSEKSISIDDSASLENFIINYAGNATSVIDISSISSVDNISVRNGTIKSVTSYTIYLSGSPATCLLENITSECSTANGMYLELSNQTTNSQFILKNLTSIVGTGGVAIDTISNRTTGDTANTSTSIIFENCTGISNSGVGIQIANGTLKKCNGFSNSSNGIVVGGTNQQSYNCYLVDCIAESKASTALILNGNAYVSGGTFIARNNSAAGKPIMLADTTGHTNYFIAGVKTIAQNTTVYGITAPTAVTARISGCQFLNQNLLTSVPGIDPGITLRAVTIDAYGNMK